MNYKQYLISGYQNGQMLSKLYCADNAFLAEQAAYSDGLYDIQVNEYEQNMINIESPQHTGAIHTKPR